MTAFILIAPQMGENIGAAARAILNFGITDLRLVAPRDGWPNEKAIKNAAGAFDKITPEIFPSLSIAVADCHYVFATTARRRDAVKPVFTPDTAITEALTRTDQKIAFIFGPERTGLENNDVTLCQAIINIPTNPDFSSLNLSQSVLLMAYEWHKQSIKCGAFKTSPPDETPVKQEELHIFLERLETDLEDKNYFRSENLKETMQRNIKNIFTRSNITDQELRTMHGILSALRGNKKPP